MPLNRLVSVAVFAALTAAACGSDVPASGPTENVTTTAATATTSTDGSIPGWAPARAAADLCSLIDVTASEGVLGVTFAQPPKAHPAKAQCTLEFGDGSIGVVLLSPTSYTGLTAAEAFTAKVSRDSQQGWDGKGESDLGDDSVYLQRDTTGDFASGMVLVLVGEEVLEISAPLASFDGEALVEFARAIVAAL